MMITVAIPVFNRDQMINDVVRSALNQRLESGMNLEVLVVDNCSTDGTLANVALIEDPRIRVVRNDKNIGMFGNFNRCRTLARGDFIRFLCSDDFLPRDVLQAEVDLLRANPTASLLNTRGRITGSPHEASFGTHFPEGLVEGSRAILEVLALLAEGRNAFNFPSGILVRASAALGCRFEESLHGLADVDFWLQLLQHGDLLNSQRIGCVVTEHPGRASHELFFSGRFLAAQIALVHNWTTRLGLSGLFQEELRGLFAGRCGYYILRCYILGRSDGARAHLKIAQSEQFTTVQIFSGLTRLGFRRLLERFAP
jgi:glycosyltransferase involved in cell wall biosynthesis